jgi:hypothetical protein
MRVMHMPRSDPAGNGKQAQRCSRARVRLQIQLRSPAWTPLPLRFGTARCWCVCLCTQLDGAALVRVPVLLRILLCHLVLRAAEVTREPPADRRPHVPAG